MLQLLFVEAAPNSTPASWNLYGYCLSVKLGRPCLFLDQVHQRQTMRWLAQCRPVRPSSRDHPYFAHAHGARPSLGCLTYRGHAEHGRENAAVLGRCLVQTLRLGRFWLQRVIQMQLNKKKWYAAFLMWEMWRPADTVSWIPRNASHGSTPCLWTC